MIVSVHPGKAHGQVTAPASKSMAHRLLLCAGLSEGVSRIRGLSWNRDIEATAESLRKLGVKIEVEKDLAVVTGTDLRKRTADAVLPCAESGSTLRFLLPLCLLSDAKATLTGTERLLLRPLSEYESAFRTMDVLFEKTKTEVTVQGSLQGGEYVLRGDVSSQFVSGLLFALPLLGEDSTIRLIPPVESRSYIEMTLSALSAFGVRARWTDETTLSVPGSQRYRAGEMTVEGDWSNAAFLEGLNLLGGTVQIQGLNETSLQGDRVYRDCFQKLEEGMPAIDLSNCPDLGPILFALAAACHGAVFHGVRRLRIKESDRIAAMQEELSKFGIRTETEADSFTVYPGLRPPDRTLYGHNDHRIVMALAVLCTLFGGVIEGAEAVSKSFPDFFEKLTDLGVKYDELDQQ